MWLLSAYLPVSCQLRRLKDLAGHYGMDRGPVPGFRRLGYELRSFACARRRRRF